MARTEAGERLTVAHRRGQLALRAGVLRDLLTLWPLVTVNDDRDVRGYQRLIAAASVLVRARARDSSSLAANYYRAFREVENAAGRAEPVLAEPPTVDEITGSLIATGLASILRSLRAGRTPAQARRSGLAAASGSVGRLVLDGGRDTVRESAAADPAALGWARVTTGSSCPFCILLATRGARYKSRTSAGDPAINAFHDHCDCLVTSVYEPDYELPEHLRRWDEVYRRVTANVDGEEKLAVFRRAVRAERGA